MKIYTECSDDVRGLCSSVLKEHHREVCELKPNIGIYFVEYDSDTKESAALKHKELPPVLRLHGVACAATIKQNSYTDRVQGKPDVTIVINAEAWDEYSIEQRTALLDHELTHLIPKFNKEGDYCVDDLGRPVFKMRQHDWDLSGFAEVTRRHGRAAIEVKAAVNFIAGPDGQMVMQFGGMQLLPNQNQTNPASDPHLLKAVRDMCPTGDGTVTISMAGKPPVTLTSDTRQNINETLKSL